ncbi:MAG: ATP-NAD kinase family protein [Candidatus Thermoplasmatota archaeon]|nr:ATP-NAD kinase family protein [Candidatus Thermoplasmatota archaeon]
MLTVGFIVNPIAGMGGSVGLKGTDGERYQKALEKGAMPVAPARARDFLQGLKVLDVEIVTVKGPMGSDVCRNAGLECSLVDLQTGEGSTAVDTARGVKALLEHGVDILAFVGGDGTARDVFGVVGASIPLVGVPAGVKMFSGVFSPTPSEACGVIEEYEETRTTTEVEILDVDEKAYAEGELSTSLFGIALAPASPHIVNVGKHVIIGESEEEIKEAIGEYVAEMVEGKTVILGPGSTVEAVARKLGVEGTLLGVDVASGGQIIVRDGGARDIEPFAGPETYVVLSPIGAQGYFLGRGTQQLTPSILHLMNLDHIIIVATPTKLKSTPTLRVDTGDPALDQKLRGYRKVVTNYRESRIVKVA